MRIGKRNLEMKLTSVVLASVVSFGLVPAAQASVTLVGTQTAFSALGTVTQNTNFDSNGPAFTRPGSPYTIGALTFIAGGQNIIGGMTASFNMARSLLSDNLINGTTIQTAGASNLFAFNLGNFFTAGNTPIDITTNLGSYAFSLPTQLYANNGMLTFAGFNAGPSEYFTSVQFSGPQATGATDIQLGTAGAVPEPATWAMMLLGFGMVGFGLRNRRKPTVRVTYA